MNVFVLTGAGISAESGLGTFRDKDGTGLWARFDPMKLATPEAFAANPVDVHAFYNARRQNLIDAKPNAAHFALAELQKSLADRNGRLTIVTQNIDDLHERAGATGIIHMHGELLKVRCRACGNIADWTSDLSVETACPVCSQTGDMRPHIVWFGEIPLFMDEIDVELNRAELFVAIGTSGSVYPAAGFVTEARRLGIRTCEINLEPSDNAYEFDETHYGPASRTVGEWAEKLIAAA